MSKLVRFTTVAGIERIINTGDIHEVIPMKNGYSRIFYLENLHLDVDLSLDQISAMTRDPIPGTLAVEDYLIVFGIGENELQARINNELKKGYILHGSIYCVEGKRYQPMIKYKD